MKLKSLSHVMLGTVLVSVLVLTGCSSGPAPITPDPEPLGSVLPEVDVQDLWLPSAVESHRIVDPNWPSAPLASDGVFVGTRVGEEVTTIEFVNADGMLQWTMERTNNCFDLDLTQVAPDESLVVVTDKQRCADDEPFTLITAFTADTGKLAWGPVEIADKPSGQGLMVTPLEAADDPETSGTDRLVLAAATGSPVNPTDLQSGTPVAEHNGQVLVAGGTDVSLVNPQEPQPLWTVPYGELETSQQALVDTAVVTLSDTLVEIQFEDHGALILSRDTGTVLSSTARQAAADPITQSAAILDADGLHSFDPEGNVRWSHSVSAQTQILSMGGALIYLRDQDAVRVLNGITGAVAQGYAPDGSGTIVVPEQILGSWEAVLWEGPKILLAFPQD